MGCGLVDLKQLGKVFFKPYKETVLNDNLQP